MSVVPRFPGSTFALLALFVSVPVLGATGANASVADAALGGPEAMHSPVAIAIAGDRVYVADFDDDRVRVLARGGALLGGWGGSGAGPGQFGGPAGIALGADGTVLVTDHFNHRVQRFTAEGEFLSEWPVGDGEGAPFGIAVDGHGRVYVTDLAAGRVAVWSEQGVELGAWGTRGAGRGELSEPWAIAVDGVGDVYVADHGNHRIQRFSGDGEWLGGWGEAGREDGLLLGPMGIAIGRDGSIHVTDLSGDRLRRFSREGVLLAAWRNDVLLAGSPASGLALDAEGAIYLADPGRQRILRVPGAPVLVAAIPTEFALLPIAQPLGRGPITIELAIPNPGTVRTEIFSLDGRRVRSVPAAVLEAGIHRVHWDTVTDDGHRAPVGMYFVRVQFEDAVRRVSRNGRVVVLR